MKPPDGRQYRLQAHTLALRVCTESAGDGDCGCLLGEEGPRTLQAASRSGERQIAADFLHQKSTSVLRGFRSELETGFGICEWKLLLATTLPLRGEHREVQACGDSKAPALRSVFCRGQRHRPKRKKILDVFAKYRPKTRNKSRLLTVPIALRVPR